MLINSLSSAGLECTFHNILLFTYTSYLKKGRQIYNLFSKKEHILYFLVKNFILPLCHAFGVYYFSIGNRGIQYACGEFTGFLSQYPFIVRSMSRKGNCWDNAVAESFFKTLKTELIYHQKYQTKQDASLSIFEYIETYLILKEDINS